MAHYAEISPDGIVLQVLVIDNAQEARDGEGGVGRWLKAHVNSTNEWLKTSYNGNIRKKYAGIGDTYDSQNNKFISPQPFPSWTLSNQDEWQPPTAIPNDGKRYVWDEATLSWQLINEV